MSESAIQIDAKELHRALLPVRNVVEVRNTIPILSHVLCVWDAEAQKLTISATDLDIDLMITVDASGQGENFAFTLPAIEFRGYVRAIVESYGTPPPIVIARGDLTDNGDRIIELSAKDTTLALTSLSVADWPRMPFDPERSPDAVVGVGRTFIERLDWVRSAVSSEKTRYYLNGVFVHPVEDGGLALVATDGHRLNREIIYRQASLDFPGVIIPRKVVALICSLSDAPESISIYADQKKIEIEYDGICIAAKLIDGPFPDYEKILPDGDGLLPGITVNSLDLYRAALAMRSVVVPDMPDIDPETDFDEWGDFVGDGDEIASWRVPVSFSLEPSARLALHASGQYSPHHVAGAVIAAEYADGATGRVALQSSYLIDLLEFETGLVTLSPSGFSAKEKIANGPVRFDFDGKPDRVAVIMPMRV